MLQAFGMWHPAATSSILALTDITVEFTDSLDLAYAGVRFNNDGSIDEEGVAQNSFAQIHTGEWATTEPSADGSLYEVRHLSAGKTGTWSNEAATADTWIDLDVDRGWNVFFFSLKGSGNKQCIATFEIRKKADISDIVSATIDCKAIVT